MEIASLTLLVLISLVAAYFDIRFRLLPNWLCIIALVAGLLISFAGGGLGAMGWSALHALIAFIIGAGLFALGWVGGGDVKYYAAIAAWFELGQGLLLLTLVAFAGFLLAIAWFYFRHRIADLAGDDRERRAELRKMPYGVAISLGAVGTALITTF